MKAFGIHAALLVVLALGTTLVRLKLSSEYSEERRQLERQASIRGSERTESAWLRCSFTTETPESFTRRIAAEFISPASGVQPEQSVKLQARITALITYLENPTFEDYYALKTQGVGYAFAATPAAIRLLSLSGFAHTNNLPTNPKELTRLVWDAIHCRAGQIRPPRVGQVCVQSIEGTFCQTNTAWSLLQGKVGNGLTKAVEQLNPGFEYPTSPDQNQAHPQHQVFFHFSFLAKMSGSTSAGPIYISLAWAPADRQWVLSRMIADSWLDLQTMF